MIVGLGHLHLDDFYEFKLNESYSYFFELVPILVHINTQILASITLLGYSLRVLAFGAEIDLNHFSKIISKAIIKFFINLCSWDGVFHFSNTLFDLFLASIEICCNNFSNIFSVLIWINGALLCLKPIKWVLMRFSISSTCFFMCIS